MTYQLRPFIRSKRTPLVSAALICYALALVLAPSGVRSQLGASRPEPLVPATVVAETPVHTVAPRDDAFMPRAQIEDDRPASIPVPPAPALPRLAGDPLLQRRVESATRITAIATGMQPTAILESGGSAHVVSIGDAIEGSPITIITATFVQLANGRRLSLEPATAQP